MDYGVGFREIDCPVIFWFQEAVLAACLIARAGSVSPR